MEKSKHNNSAQYKGDTWLNYDTSKTEPGSGKYCTVLKSKICTQSSIDNFCYRLSLKLGKKMQINYLRDLSLFMMGGGTEEKCFSWQNVCWSNLNYQLKNKYPLLVKYFTKGYHSVLTNVLYHICDVSLINVCATFCLKFHVVRICSFFGDTICFLTNQKTIKIVNLILSTYDCWHSFLVIMITILEWVMLWKWQ